jgi:hypothetical protein
MDAHDFGALAGQPKPGTLHVSMTSLARSSHIEFALLFSGQDCPVVCTG